MSAKDYILLFFFIPSLLFGQIEHLVQPNMVDSLSGAPNNNHFVYTNQTISQKNKLFLFFPGTGAVPYNYREILKHAANLGYHAIGLTYPNSEAINQICLASTDTTCHSRARLEVFDGVDRHADVNVDVNNCIERRALRLLQYLSSHYPSENWGQYYIGNQIQWNKVIVSGHSQGGGHAGVISKIKEVDRVVMFAAMDWIPLLNRNADWITWHGPTPADRYYGFVHQNDESVDFEIVQTTWDNYGMNSFGHLVLVDTCNNSFENSHKLYTVLTPANDSTKYHNAVVVDVHTPMHLGLPVYAPVWTYMIQGSGALTSTHSSQYIQSLNIYPNPSCSFFNIQGLNGDHTSYSVFNLQGKMVESGRIVNNKIDIPNLNEGVYILKIEGEFFSSSIKIIKK